MTHTALSGLLFSVCLTATAQVNVLTYHNDLARTGQNLSETLLTPANVNSQQFGKLFSYPVDGYVYAQPLYLTGVTIPGKGAHNVVYVATEHDSVYAFDADSDSGANASPLWQVNFLDPAAGVTTVPFQNAFNCGQITPEIGITGTPVIDPVSGTLYVVAMTMETSSGGTTYAHRLHALDVATGAERSGSPVLIEASMRGSGDGGSMVTFIPRNYKQRPGLLLLNGVVYTSWSSHCDLGTYHGWIMGYDAKTLRQVSVYNSTPNGSLGSFWSSGAAPAVDAQGNIYVISGNGTFDADAGGPNLGESFIKLSPANGLTAVDYFTPFNQVDLNRRDADTGSSGPLLLPDSVGSSAHPHLLVSAGKEGRIYLLDRDNMGRFQSGSDSQVVQSTLGIGALFGVPAYFNGVIYLSGVDDAMKAFPISNATLTTPPSSRTAISYGAPGSVPSISANGTANGIVWVIEASGNGTLRAYDAGNLATELYNSRQNSSRDSLGSYVKFSVPTVVNGRVYAGTRNSLVVYGLLNQPALPSAGVVNAAGFRPGPLAPGSFLVLFGENLMQSTATASTFPLPTTLAGVTLRINGVPAPIYYVSPTQVSAQIPYETAPGAGSAVLTVGGSSLPAVTFTVQAVSPGIFIDPANWALAQDANGVSISPTRPAPAGSYVVVYGTGQGSVDNPVPTGAPAPLSPLSRMTSPVTATVGGQSAEVFFAGLTPTLVGVFQINLRIPLLPPGDYPLVITIGGAQSNSAQIRVSAAQ